MTARRLVTRGVPGDQIQRHLRTSRILAGLKLTSISVWLTVRPIDMSEEIRFRDAQVGDLEQQAGRADSRECIRDGGLHKDFAADASPCAGSTTVISGPSPSTTILRSAVFVAPR